MQKKSSDCDIHILGLGIALFMYLVNYFPINGKIVSNCT